MGAAGIWSTPGLRKFLIERAAEGKTNPEIREAIRAAFGLNVTTQSIWHARERAESSFCASLSDLVTPVGGYAPPAPKPEPKHVHMKGWEPRVEITGDEGVGITDVLDSEQTLQNEADLIRGWQLDPEHWRILPPLTANKWQTTVMVGTGEERHSEQKWNYQYKAKLVRREKHPDLAPLIAEISKHKRGKCIANDQNVYTSGASLVVCWSDTQLGKGDGDGAAGTVARCLEKIDAVEDLIRRHRKAGVQLDSLYVFGIGDLIESCVAGETEVITRTGVVPIAKLAELGRATVKTDYGRWIEAEIRSFGQQPLLRVELSRGQAKKTIFATPEHRWFRLADPSRNSERQPVTTSELRVGDMLISSFGKHPKHMSPVGVMAGYVYGDGHRESRDPQHGSSVMVHRGDFAMLDYFEGHPMSGIRKHGESEGMVLTEASDTVKVSGLPAFFKAAPSLDESLPFLYGWAAGYFAADGSVAGKSVTISSANRESLEIFASVCSRLGIGTNPITSSWRVGCGTEPTELFRLSLVASTVPPEFFVLPHKRQQFDTMRGAVGLDGYVWQRNRSRHWRVDAVQSTDRIEEVYCAVVPVTHSFTLANDLLTGNCDGHYAQQAFRTELNLRDQVKVARRLIAKSIERWAPLFEKVVVGCIGGNHGENRKDGKSFTDFADNHDVAIFEQIAEAFSYNADAFGHVSFVIPKDELSLTFDVSGVVVGITHGHTAGKGAGLPQKKLLDWWMKQAHGMQPVGDATILISGHYHHFSVIEAGRKVHVQCPALEGGSDWFRNMTGQEARPGMLTMVVGKGVSPAGYGSIEIL